MNGSEGTGAPFIASRAARRRRKQIAAAILFVLTPLTALVVQDLYDKAKSTVDSTPLNVAVAPYDDCPFGQWLFPPGFDPKTLPPFDQLDSQWAGRHGGWPVGRSATSLTFQAEGQDAVVMQGMRIRVVERHAPAPGVRVTKCQQSTRVALDVRDLDVDLDDREPSVILRPADPGGARDTGDRSRFGGFPYRVSASDPEVFHLRADTENCTCTWEAVVEWTAAGRMGNTVLRFDSAPFRISAGKGPQRVSYAYNPDGTLEKTAG